MSTVRTRRRIDPTAPYAIVLRAYDAAEPVVLRSAHDADAATAAFSAERRRRTPERVVGHLLVRQDEGTRPLLPEALR
jgi:hypothetical protein